MRASTSIALATLLVMVALATLAAEPPRPEGATLAAPEPVPAGPPERGYVPDSTCGRCHAELYASYQEVGMARSFADAARAERIEDYDAAVAYHHEPSGRYYRMSLGDDGRPKFRRWQLDEAGREINVYERDVDWILGSGHTSRSYLVQDPHGEMVMLPLAWYSQEGRWAMAPGFDHAAHPGLTREVQRGCMFCHNAYPPEVPPGSDLSRQPHLFPHRLAEGTGCQRCHGPGARHVDTAIFGGSPEMLRSSIVNPARLEGRRRHEVCYQCHLQPSVAMMPLRHLGRGDYSYTPDQPLDDYIVFFDPIEEQQSQGERFEINHHPYRLEQSRCFIESGGALGCTNCHDPHRKVPKAERAAHYRAVCVGCHALDAPLAALHAAAPTAPSTETVDPGDCVACHMPRRRTQDVVHVVMTDHRIQRGPGSPELLAPRAERVPTLIGIEFWDPTRAPGGGRGALADAYQAMAVLQSGGGGDASAHLERSLAKLGTTSVEQDRELALALLSVRRFSDADRVLDRLLAADPDDPLSLGWRGTVLAAKGDLGAARLHFERSLVAAPDTPGTLYNLARVLEGLGQPTAAETHLRRAVALRPLMAVAWHALGRLLGTAGRPAEAVAPLRQALALEPTLTAAYLELGAALIAVGDPDEAHRILRHGTRWATDPTAVAAALAALPAQELD